ncbi:hypothetical protein MTO96_030573, partial [Rhipicephalus appendiculatus]
PSYVDNCTCLVDGRISRFPDNTTCYAPAFGYDFEYANRLGKCKNGTCILDYVPRGCEGERPRNRNESKELGCTFLCYNETLRRVEYGFYQEGSFCLHYNNLTVINSTCKRSGENVICRENVDTVPAC